MPDGEELVSPTGSVVRFWLRRLRVQSLGLTFVNFIITWLPLRLEGKVSSLQTFMSLTVYLAPLCAGHPGKWFKYRVSSTPAFLQCGHDRPHFADELREGQGLAQGDPESMGGVFQPQGRGAPGVQSLSGFQKLTPGHSTRWSDRWMVGKQSVAGKRMNNSMVD